MTQRVPLAYMQYTASSDFDKYGRFSQENLAAFTRAIVGIDRAWSGFFLSKDSDVAVTVTVGVVFRNGRLYTQPYLSSDSINFTTKMPLGAKLYATLVAYTTDDKVADSENRTFYNEETDQEYSKETPIEMYDAVSLEWLFGEEALTPQIHPIEPHMVPIAHVLLGTQKIEDHFLAEEFRQLDLEQVLSRLGYLEQTTAASGSAITTLQTELTGIKASIPNVSERAVFDMQRDLSGIKKQIGFRSDVAYDTDFFLDESKSATGNEDYASRIDNGLLNPYADQSVQALQLDNPHELTVTELFGQTMAKFERRKMLDIWGRYNKVALGQFNYANTSGTIYAGARRRRKFGVERVVTSQMDEWKSLEYYANYLTMTYKKDGETWNILETWDKDGISYVRLEGYHDDRIPYWTGARTEDYVVDGFSLFQTWLQPHPMMLDQIGYFIVLAAPDQPVYVAIGECDGFVPDMSAYLTTGEIPANAEIAGDTYGADAFETKATMKPVFLKGNTRYFMHIWSPGDHHFAVNNTNAYTNGTLWSFDGSSFVPHPGQDLNFRLHGHKYEQNRIELKLNTINLPGGITDIDILSDELTPDGPATTEIEFFVKKQGASEKIPLKAIKDNHPLTDKPETLTLYAVLNGTIDLMPMIDLANSRVIYGRAAAQGTHFSAPVDHGFAVQKIEMEVLIDNYNDANHTVDITVIALGSEHIPFADTPIDIGGGSLIRRLSFDLGALAATYDVKIVRSSTVDTDLPVVSFRSSQGDV